MTNKRRRLVYGVGINDADYAVQINEMVGGKQKSAWRCPFYTKWTNMLTRAYNKKVKSKYPTYENVTICEEWLTFSNFKKWMERQDWEGKHLDKDILFPGNKEYNPETCVFVDKRINVFVIESDSARGDYPIGVSFHKFNNRFMAKCNNPFKSKLEYLGYFNSPEDAHNAWLTRKLELAKLLAAEQTDERVAKAIVERYENYLSNKTREELNYAITLVLKDVTLLSEDQLDSLYFNLYIEQSERNGENK